MSILEIELILSQNFYLDYLFYDIEKMLCCLLLFDNFIKTNAMYIKTRFDILMYPTNIINEHLCRANSTTKYLRKYK